MESDRNKTILRDKQKPTIDVQSEYSPRVDRDVDENTKSRGDGVVLIDEVPVTRDHSKFTGRFAIVLPGSGQVLLFGKCRLWEKREDAEFHLRHSQGYALPGDELQFAFVGELGEDFWLDE